MAGGVPGAGTVLVNFGAFTANHLGGLTSTDDIKPLMHLNNPHRAGGTDDVTDMAARVIIARCMTKVKRTLMNVLRDPDEFACHAAAQLIGADLTNPVNNDNHMPEFYYEEVCISIVQHLQAANLYAVAGANPAGPLHGTATNQFFTDITASNTPADAHIASATLQNAYDFIIAVLEYFPQQAGRARSNAVPDFVLIGVALAKRGQATRDYLRKREPKLREEFHCDNIDVSPNIIRCMWFMYLQDLTHAMAPDVLATLSDFAPPNAVVYKEIIRQAQFGGFTTVVLITNAIREYATFPWGALFGGTAPMAPEFHAFNQDALQVAADAYAAYGQRKLAGNMKYKHMTYVAIGLLRRGSNIRTLADYAGNTGPLTHKAQCDAWTDAHIAALQGMAAPYPGQAAAFPLPNQYASIPTL